MGQRDLLFEVGFLGHRKWVTLNISRYVVLIETETVTRVIYVL